MIYLFPSISVQRRKDQIITLLLPTRQQSYFPVIKPLAVAPNHCYNRLMDIQEQLGVLTGREDVNGFPLLPDEQPVTTVRDSLYDLIPLGPREEKLIGTAPFLRLQKIKQLGFVYRIWPGATHTRYEHSLGCYYLAVRALRSLLQRGDDGGLFGISVSSVQTLVVATLLHDIGHYPFSHTIEELGYPIITHEKVGRSIIEKSEIAAILESDYHLSPERVADVIDPPKTKALPADDQLLISLLSGALYVDK